MVRSKSNMAAFSSDLQRSGTTALHNDTHQFVRLDRFLVQTHPKRFDNPMFLPQWNPTPRWSIEMHDHPHAESIRTTLFHGKKSQSCPYSSFRFLSFLMSDLWLSRSDVFIRQQPGVSTEPLPFHRKGWISLCTTGKTSLLACKQQEKRQCPEI